MHEIAPYLDDLSIVIKVRISTIYEVICSNSVDEGAIKMSYSVDQMFFIKLYRIFRNNNILNR
jgi:hypothetical protein